jgi:hypothetical protein
LIEKILNNNKEETTSVPNDKEILMAEIVDNNKEETTGDEDKRQ